MANTKKCSCCKELKSTKLFSKRVASKDGLQGYCKVCLSINSGKLLKAGTTGSIYKITNPDGYTYIGKTFKVLKYRFSIHISECKNGHKYSRKESAPLLFQSFRKFGIDAHDFELINEYPNISKEDLREIETNLIQKYKQSKKSLNANN